MFEIPWVTNTDRYIYFSFADNLIENLCQNHAHLSDQQVENGERIFYFKPAKMNNVSMVIG